MRFWIGARGADMGAEGRGISAMTAGDADSPLAGGALADRGLAVETPSPTWLAAHPRLAVVYAALEGEGRVAAFRRTGETALEPMGAPIPAGETVCHLAVAPDGSYLIASCWGDGGVVLVPLRPDGSLGEPARARAAGDPYAPGAAAPDWAVAAPVSPTQREEADALAAIEESAADDAHETASGLLLPGAGAIDGLLDGPPDPQGAAAGLAAAMLDGEDAAEAVRRAAQGAAPAAPGTQGPAPAGSAPSRPSRAHSAAFLPDGRVATADLGYDLIRIWRVAASGLVPDHEVALPFGVGPRHMLVHPSGHLHVVTEFSCEVWTLRRGQDDRWRIVQATPTGAQAGDRGAEIAAGHDRRFLYAGLRGSDTISVMRVAGEGESLQPVALVESGIRTPRHHVVVRDSLLIAGQASNEVVSLPVDTRTGAPGTVRRRLEAPTPQHILPAP